jgi:hypothetical protein
VRGALSNERPYRNPNLWESLGISEPAIFLRYGEAEEAERTHRGDEFGGNALLLDPLLARDQPLVDEADRVPDCGRDAHY